MSFHLKPPPLVQASDLQALVTDQVPEDKYLEYKQALPGKADSDRKEFLADVSAFANAGGGDLIFGISDENGLPKELCGVATTDSDETIRRLEEMVQDGISPRILGITTRAVPLAATGVAIIMRIPPSWANPHMVTYQKYFRFYSRNSAGKYLLDVSELRTAFTQSLAAGNQVQNFRLSRLGKALADELPVSLPPGPKLVLHLIPRSILDPTNIFDLTALPGKPENIRPVSGGQGWSSPRYNFDGLLTVSGTLQQAEAYLQIFRNGIIECVDTRSLDRNQELKYIRITALENLLIQEVPRLLRVQQQLGVSPPVAILLSILGVKDFTLAVEGGLSNSAIDRPDLLLPEIATESFEIDIAALLKPMFDILWNTVNYPGSANYNNAGQRR